MSFSTNPPVPAVNPSRPEKPGSISAHGLTVASAWSRFGNFLIDYAIVIVSLLCALRYVDAHEASESMKILSMLMIYGLYPLYVIVCESAWQQTIAKHITRTKVVDINGNKPSFLRIVGRTVVRFVPFEPFSFLSAKYPIGWHDNISGTYVVPAHYTPEQVRSIDKVSMKKRGGLGIVIGVLAGIAVIGMLSSLVLASLATAREKGEDGLKRASMLSGISASSTAAADNDTYEADAKTFTNAAGDISAFFPIKPRTEFEPKIPLDGSDLTYDYHGYMATDKGVTYVIGKYVHTPLLAPHEVKEEGLRGFLEGFRSDIHEARLSSSEYSVKEGHPGLDFVIAYPGYLVAGRYVSSNGILYMYMTEYPSDTRDKGTIDKFMRSVVIK